MFWSWFVLGLVGIVAVGLVGEVRGAVGAVEEVGVERVGVAEVELGELGFAEAVGLGVIENQSAVSPSLLSLLLSS